jgi:hypothetical protein
MNRMRLGFSAAIIAAVVLIVFMLSVPHTRDLAVKESVKTPHEPVVTLRDTFKKGVHTLSGSVEAPTACAEVSVTASAIGSASSTEGILVDITMPEDTGICLQKITDIPFQTTITAPAGLPIEIKVNGARASTTPS